MALAARTKTIVEISIVAFIFAACIPFSSEISCNKVVKVESTEVMNYLGNVTFTVPIDFTGIWNMTLQTHTPFAFFGGWGIRVRTDPSNKLVKISSAEVVDLFPGDKLSFRFRLYWAVNTTIPLVENIIWEGLQICTQKGRRASSYFGRKMKNSIIKYKYNYFY